MLHLPFSRSQVATAADARLLEGDRELQGCRGARGKGEFTMLLVVALNILIEAPKKGLRGPLRCVHGCVLRRS